MGAEETSFGRTQSETTQHFMLGTRHWAGAFVTQGWKVHFLTRGPTGKMYLPPGYIPAKSGCGRHFLWEGGLQLEGFLGWFHTMSPWAAGNIPRALAYYSQGEPGSLTPFYVQRGGLCGLQHLLTGPLSDHARRPVSFLCGVFPSSSVQLVS